MVVLNRPKSACVRSERKRLWNQAVCRFKMTYPVQSVHARLSRSRCGGFRCEAGIGLDRYVAYSDKGDCGVPTPPGKLLPGKLPIFAVSLFSRSRMIAVEPSHRGWAARIPTSPHAPDASGSMPALQRQLASDRRRRICVLRQPHVHDRERPVAGLIRHVQLGRTGVHRECIRCLARR